MEIKFTTVKGHRLNSILLWSYDESCLYFRKYKRSGKETFLCYENILKKNSKNNSKQCSAIVVLKDGTCRRTLKRHASHPDHKQIYNDLETRNSIVDKCVAMKEILEGIPFKIPDQDIFTLALSKLVIFI